MLGPVPNLTIGLAQLRASCPRGLGAECICAARIEASGDVEHFSYLLDDSPAFMFGLPLLDLADMMMGMLVVSNLNQTGLRELPPLEDAELMDDDRLLFGENLIDWTEEEFNALRFGEPVPTDSSTDVMDDIRSLAEPPFDLVPINDDGPERDLYGQLPVKELHPA